MCVHAALKSASTLYRMLFLFAQQQPLLTPRVLIIPLIRHCEASPALVDLSHSGAPTHVQYSPVEKNIFNI